MLFYTGKGDKGSSQVGKKKVPKDSPIMVALGELDELNSVLGLVKARTSSQSIKEAVGAVQETLFIIQAQTAGLMFPSAKAQVLSPKKVRELEQEIEAIETKLNPSRGFVVSGSSLDSAWLDVARTVARRAERAMNVLRRKKNVDPQVLAYLNRLSSYLYALARKHGKNEQHPTYA